MKKGCAMQSLRRSISWPAGDLERRPRELGVTATNQPTTEHSFCSTTTPETPPGNQTKAAPLRTLRIFSYISWDQGCNGVATGWDWAKVAFLFVQAASGSLKSYLSDGTVAFGNGRWVDGGCIHWWCLGAAAVSAGVASAAGIPPPPCTHFPSFSSTIHTSRLFTLPISSQTPKPLLFGSHANPDARPWTIRRCTD